MKTCPACGKRYDDGWKTCLDDQAVLRDATTPLDETPPPASRNPFSAAGRAFRGLGTLVRTVFSLACFALLAWITYRWLDLVVYGHMPFADFIDNFFELLLQSGILPTRIIVGA